MRERAVRMLFEHQHEYPSQWKAIESIAKKLNICLLYTSPSPRD